MIQIAKKTQRSDIGSNDSDPKSGGKIPGFSTQRGELKVGEHLLDPANPQQVSAYILDMTMAMRNVASNAGLDFLAYLLDMAAEESQSISRGAQEGKSAQPANHTGRLSG